MRPRVMPGQRMQRIVAIRLTAVPMLPKPDDQDGDRPVVGARTRRECARGQRRVGPPPHVRRVARAVQAAAAEKAEIQQEPAERAQPEAEGIQARKRHVARADHQRHQVVAEPEQDRHGEEEDHRRAVHREHPVEHLRRHEIVVRVHQLDADDERLDAGNDEEEEREQDVQQPDPLVIDGRHPRVKRLAPGGRLNPRALNGDHV